MKPPPCAAAQPASQLAPAMQPNSGTVLAFDFGAKRIGVAVGEFAFRQANALGTIEAAGIPARFAAVARYIEEWRPVRLVVGLPRAADGTPHEMSARCTRFANQLRGRFCLPVETVDERLSSWEAADNLGRRARPSAAQRRAIDAEAARIILQSYFDEAPRS